jgi:hypothetical protein
MLKDINPEEIYKLKEGEVLPKEHKIWYEWHKKPRVFPL